MTTAREVFSTLEKLREKTKQVSAGVRESELPVGAIAWFEVLEERLEIVENLYVLGAVHSTPTEPAPPSVPANVRKAEPPRFFVSNLKNTHSVFDRRRLEAGDEEPMSISRKQADAEAIAAALNVVGLP